MSSLISLRRDRFLLKKSDPPGVPGLLPGVLFFPRGRPGGMSIFPILGRFFRHREK